jgi:sphingomyelin phosphodiesterase acid-like 3
MRYFQTRLSARFCSVVLLASLCPFLAASTPDTKNQGPGLPVVMLSDIHFDPFHDPAKFAQLRKTSPLSWSDILNSADSPTQAADFAALQSTCGAKGVDTPIELLQSSLRAAKLQQPKPLFLTLSGDLMAHQFDCRFHTLAPGATAAEYSAFAAKTVSFVALQIWQYFPHTPVYIALGNNDSGCMDYREDPNSDFLRSTAIEVNGNTQNPQARYAILHEFPHYGDYNIQLPGPMSHTHLLVLQDIFESKRYTTCSGANSTDPAKAQVAWLRAQLAAARKAHQTVWVMAHIPPGIDAYSTLAKAKDVCGGDKPANYLGSDDLLKAITDYGDVVRLALFGHTHMDELRVYTSTADVKGPPSYIPGKLVPSISPVNGNLPAFTIAQVNPKTATLKDYAVYVADTPNGIDMPWMQEYRYSTDFALPDLSGASLEKLITGFVDDKDGTQPTTLDYQQHFFVGGAGKASAAMKLAWPTYACAMSQGTDAGFHSCMCPAKPENAAAPAPVTLTP